MNAHHGDPARAYLFLLSEPSTAVRRQTAARLRELGLTVVMQYDEVAIEALATSAQARAAEELDVFAAVLKGPMADEHLERLTDPARSVVQLWNAQFTEERRARRQRRSKRGRSWGDPELAPPGPHSVIAPQDFRQFVEQYERRTGQAAWQPEDDSSSEQRSPAPPARDPRLPPGVLPPEQFARYEQRLAEIYGDPTVAYHLARLATALGTDYHRRFERLSPEFVRALWSWAFPEAECWKMTGEMAFGLVIVESSLEDGPEFAPVEHAEVIWEIRDGLKWLAEQHPGGELSWVEDMQSVRIEVPNGDDSEANCPGMDSLEASWRDPAMARVNYFGTSYPGSWAAVAQYRESMRTRNDAAHAFVIFVTPYANCWHAYAGGGRIVLAKRNDWGNWGRDTLDAITAHEVSHLFGAADEYGGKGTPCRTCDTVHGCDQIPNGNCDSCARPTQACVMEGNNRRLCAYSRGQIGWSHLFVELTTADERWAGTNDTVTLDIGDRTFNLDTADHDDRERDNREGYALWVPDLRREDLKRILIRKSEDGWGGGWNLDGVRVWFQGQLICDQAGIDVWLEDDERTWVGCINTSELVNELEVHVTTADVRWAGTDDDVSLTMAGRTWDLDNAWHNDFERGNTDTFTLDPGSGLNLSDLHSVEIRKSSDGFAGGWKLAGLRVVANGSDIFNDQAINKWLEDDDRTWSATF